MNWGTTSSYVYIPMRYSYILNKKFQDLTCNHLTKLKYSKFSSIVNNLVLWFSHGVEDYLVLLNGEQSHKRKQVNKYEINM